MVDKKDKANNVETLLADKQQIEEWIERLDLAGDEVADDVRTKVKTDYETRLAGVMKELNQYADELSESLKAEVARREKLWEEERAGKERFAEAQLRHTVGEHSDKEWQEIQAEVNETLQRLETDLDKTTAEITRLEDVLGAMTAAPKKTAAAAALAPEAKEEKEKSSEPKGEAKEGEPQTEAFKEKDLTLIKSAKTESAPKEKVEEPAAEAKPAVEKVPRPSSIGIEAPLPKADKTLKCGECSAMNFPTEWYCEQCGAELASL